MLGPPFSSPSATDLAFFFGGSELSESSYSVMDSLGGFFLAPNGFLAGAFFAAAYLSAIVMRVSHCGSMM
jgi:hypothetical protein